MCRKKRVSSLANNQTKPNYARGLLRAMGRLSAIDMLAFIVGGFAIFMIVYGALHGSLRLAPYWEPAFRVWEGLMGKSDAPQVSRISLRGWHLIFRLPVLMLYIGVVSLGVVTLLRQGFCGQNLVCLLIRER